jgi:hypothetical protein
VSGSLEPGELAAIDQAHEAAMRELDAFVDSCRPFLAERGAVTATAVLGMQFEERMEAGDPELTPRRMCLLAAQAVIRLAAQHLTKEGS